MSGLKYIGTILFLAATVMTGTSHAGAETCNRVVAIVNDDVITLHELNKKIKEMTGHTPHDLKLRDESRYIETRRQILDLLIDSKISEEKIKEMGINVTEKQIDETIEKIKKDNHWTHEDLMYGLQSEGLTYEQYRANIKKDLERLHLINFEVKSKIIIREETISQYYENHKEEFSSQGKVHLASIFLMLKDPKDREELESLTQKGEAILTELKGGKDFGELAGKYSDGPGVDEGGDLGVFKITQLDPELRKMLESIPVGGVSELIIRPQGIQIIKLIGKESGKLKGLEEVRDAIYGLLYREEVNKRYAEWIEELRDRSYTKIIF